MGLIALADGLEYLRWATGTGRACLPAGALSAEVRNRVADLAETLEGLAQILAGKAEYDAKEVWLRVSQTPDVMDALRSAVETERDGGCNPETRGPRAWL